MCHKAELTKDGVRVRLRPWSELGLCMNDNDDIFMAEEEVHQVPVVNVGKGSIFLDGGYRGPGIYSAGEEKI